MKKKSNITSNSKIDLEDKIVEISLKNKQLTTELETVKNENSKIINKLIHNLKNPVGSSFSFAEMLIDNSMSFDAEKTKKYLSIIKNSSHYAIEILNSFAKLNSIKSTNFQLNISNSNYSTFISEIIEFSKTKYANNNINFNIYIEDNIYFNFDKTELKYAINQLINNAIRFSKKDTPISIIVEKINNAIITTITDNGIGFETENTANLFKEFFIENTYDVHQKKCLGLGLAIVKKIINSHNGSINITKNQSIGTSIKLLIPA
ncbi:HAMP domain-containing sensor histidine kinase [Lutibacter sp. TH_r2]|uniref:sensor histidine kinase n=1 Tax=Lutibacter sp. TH_r2 TaxID=3082083 RepID=UPI00295399E0|nr:HAMP domain-containing sensor histidine kinase [Lutibacter sp. TH_r2]MDV7186337.1 HAMP domain-containing sensor histidine kinase [Lutibacter sp. TH_r2]